LAAITPSLTVRAMASFDPILKAALERVGDVALKKRLPAVKSAAALRRVSDDRYLSLMSLRIFRAGLNHEMVDKKWPAFEDAFRAFEPRRVAAMSDEALEALMKDARLIRHWGKIKSVRENAAAVQDVAQEAGGIGAWLAGWPGSDIVGLWDELASRFSQMGGHSGPYFLRMAGKDLHPHAVGGERTHPRPRERRPAKGQGWTREGPGRLQRLGRGDRAPALPPQHDPGHVGRLTRQGGKRWD
jgi:3-methyladenine DNA glycosylase Tag